MEWAPKRAPDDTERPSHPPALPAVQEVNSTNPWAPLLGLAFFPGPRLTSPALIQIHGDAIGHPSAKPTPSGLGFEDHPSMAERPFEVPDHGSLLEILEEIHRKNLENAVVLVYRLPLLLLY